MGERDVGGPVRGQVSPDNSLSPTGNPKVRVREERVAERAG